MNITNAGTVPVIGRPNAGKSTLINKLIGEKISIVSDKPQTTRRSVCAVLNEGNTQCVLIDTPGFHKPRSKLGGFMAENVFGSLSGADAVVLVCMPVPSVGDIEEELINKLSKSKAPVLLAVNKIDTVEKTSIMPVIDQYSKRLDFHCIVPVSAQSGDGMDILKRELLPLMPEGPALFGDGETTDMPDRMYASEIIREKILLKMYDEIPHGVAVVCEEIKERADGLINITATIYCEKKNHKAMLLGKKGSCIGEIGKNARLEFEEIYETRVNLRLWVKVSENWRDEAGALSRFGYR